MPYSQIEALWRWNYNRERRQNELGELVFVPKIFCLDVGGEVRTGVTWGDGIPILLPVVDIVLVPRRRLAPRRWFQSKDDTIVLSWAELEPIVQRFQEMPGETPSYELFYEATPADIEQVIRGKQPPTAKPKGVAFDEVLDRESAEQARGQQLTSG